MSVTTSGPEGYEYQYFVSVYLVLLYMRDHRISCAFIEQLNQEDLSLKMTDGSIADFQFKKRTSELELDTLASCLVKFNPHSSNINILTKLADGTLDHFYLITDARAGNFSLELGILLKENSLVDHVNKKRKKTTLDDLFNSILNVYNGSSAKALEIKRNIFIKSQVEDLKKDAGKLSLVLDKIHVMEYAATDKLREKINFLMGQLGIIFSSQEFVLNKLLDIVKNNRANGHDIAIAFQSIVDKNIRNLPSPDKYFMPSGSEGSLLSKLSSQQYLLLSGISLCGKSQTALYISSLLCGQHQGIAYKATTSITEAENYLLDNSNEARLCLLEDPFGQAYNAGRTNDYYKLENLVLHIKDRKEKYLIVTSNNTILTSLTSTIVMKNEWEDLTIKDRTFLQALWLKISGSYGDNFFNTTVKRILQKDAQDSLLQPGQLGFINRYRDKLQTVTEQAIRHLANFNSQDIEEQIKASGIDTVDIMLISGITATTVSGITEDDLKYMFMPDYFPGINKQSEKFRSLFGLKDLPDPKISQYAALSPLSAELDSDVERILDKGLLHFEKGIYRFPHPIFEGGAKRLLNAVNNPIRLGKIFKFLKKGIGSLNVNAALNSVESLYILTDYLIAKNHYDNTLNEIATAGLDSTFINVRSAALQFLVQYYSFLPENLGKIVEDKVRNRSFSSLDFYWSGTTAFIPDNEYPSNRNAILNKMQAGRIAPEIWNRYIENKERLSPADASTALEYLVKSSRQQKKRIAYDPALLLPFFRYDELFIVEDAAYLLAASLDEVNYNDLKEMLIEDRPVIRFQLMKGLIKAYPYCQDKSIKEDMFLKMKSLLDNRFVSLRALDLFTQFNSGHTPFTFDWDNEVEDFAVEEMWTLWAELSLIMIKNLPSRININDARFSDSLREASLKSIGNVYDLTMAWMGWLKGHFTDIKKYETDISSSILYYFNNNLKKLPSNQRLSILDHALEIDNIIFRGRLFRIFFYNWDNIGEMEHAALKVHAQNASEFHKAIILTTKDCPTEIYKMLCNGMDLHQMQPQRIVYEMDNDLFMNCLVLLYIFPPTMDLDYHGFSVWNPVLAYLIDHPNHDAFWISINVYLDEKLTYRRTGNCHWPTCKKLGPQLVSHLDLDKCEMVLNIIINGIGNNNNENLKFLNHVVSILNAVQKDLLGKMIEQNLEMISGHDDLQAIPNNILEEYCYSKLGVDITILNALDNELIASEDKVMLINAAVSEKAIRLQNTILEVRDWERKNKILFNEDQIEAIESYLKLFFEISDKQKRDLRDKVESQFVKWFI